MTSKSDILVSDAWLCQCEQRVNFLVRSKSSKEQLLSLQGPGVGVAENDLKSNTHIESTDIVH